ncbi:MAG: hypothetical protein L3J24_11920 [Xanthomonadales bacterium]|nr:hypothetical protein [Xanthomonadales bacterium]
MKVFHRISLLTTLLLLSTFALALSPLETHGPWVPCVGCEDLTVAPYPESGLWSNPELSPGSALNLEIQNGVLAGYLYTYNDAGQPEWFIISGPLVRSENVGVVWELKTNLVRVEGGTCFGCSFIPPDQITSGEQVTLLFRQRNHLQISVLPDSEGGPAAVPHTEYFVPFTYGSSGKAYFNQQTPYILPEFGPNINIRNTLFLISVRPSAAADDYLLRAQHVYVQTHVTGTGENRVLTYSLQGYEPNGPIASPTPPPWGNIICEIDEETASPGCRIEAEGITYRMPIGNFSDSRFFAEAEDGSIIEGFRIEYD